MNKLKIFFISFFTVTSSIIVEAEARNFSISITGGGKPEDTMVSFYRNGVVKAHEINQAFSIAPKDSSNFFGSNNIKDYCYWDYAGGVSDEVLRNKERFMKGRRCSDSAQIFNFMISDTKKDFYCHGQPNPRSKEENVNLDDVNGDGISDVTASASWAKIRPKLEQIVRDSKVGDHVIININDHGMKEGGSWYVGLGPSTEKITVADVSEYTARLEAKGVTVHLNVMACFSGGFNSLTSNTSLGKTCGIAQADPDIVGYGEDALVPKTFDTYFMEDLASTGNQLEAFACAMGKSTVNRPNTSLDYIVNNWLMKSVTHQDSICRFNSITAVEAKIKELLDTLKPNAKRKTLIKAFRDKFVNVVTKCSQEKSSDDGGLFGALKSCVDDPDSKLNPGYRDYIRDFLSASTGNAYNLESFERHIEFLEKAPNEQLRKYQDAFCCLAYNFKENSSPEFCK